MIVLYDRVSTTDQTTAHQVSQAKAAGFKIDKVVSDEGVSGIATKLCAREQGKRLFDMLRSGDTLVVRWVDRLGRNYIDVVDTIRDFMRRGVIIRTVINGFACARINAGYFWGPVARIASQKSPPVPRPPGLNLSGLESHIRVPLAHQQYPNRPRNSGRDRRRETISVLYAI
jgi:hypothetical protein